MEDEKEIYEKLTSEIQNATWAPLEEHLERGGLLIVSNDLDLVEVGVKIATDDVEFVKDQLKLKKLIQPMENQAEAFRNDDDLQFRFIIVQPYVLAQIIIED